MTKKRTAKKKAARKSRKIVSSGATAIRTQHVNEYYRKKAPRRGGVKQKAKPKVVAKPKPMAPRRPRRSARNRR